MWPTLNWAEMGTSGIDKSGTIGECYSMLFIFKFDIDLELTQG